MTILRDFQYGIRMLFSKPAFAIAAIAVLALGIGANTAIFSLVNAFLLKPLAVEKPQELVGLYSRDTKQPEQYRGFSYPNFQDVRDNNPVFASLTAHTMALVGLAEGDATRRVFSDVVPSNYFATFGVRPFRGRTFNSEEDRPGSGNASVIVSYSFWRKKGSDPDFLGKTLRINGRIFTVIGIAPEGFTGTTALFAPELYLPMGMYENVINDFEGRSRPLAARNNDALVVVGRLRPGMSIQTANPLLAAVGARMESAYPAENKDQTLVASPLSRLGISTSPAKDTQLFAPAAMLLGIAGVVLLIASLNVANMMLARGTARRKEIAIRLALGAGRRNILQQLFMEGLVLSLLGGAAGLMAAYWSTTILFQSLTHLAPIDLVYPGGPDLRVLAATIGFCLLSTLLFGLGPAWSLSKPNILPSLKAGENSDTSPQKRLFSRRNILVMGQISLSLMLLSAAGLFIRSSMSAARVEPGFRMDNGIVLEVDPSLAGYDETRGRQTYRALIDRLRTVPGVELASVAATVPFGMVSLGRTIQKASDAVDSKTGSVDARLNLVGEDYFRTLGIPLERGRAFLAGETSGKLPPVVILDKLAAARLWPKGDAVGQRIRMAAAGAGKPGTEAEVVGVVAATQENIFGPGLSPHLYVPFGQEYQADMNIHLKIAAASREAEGRVLEAVRREIRASDDRLPVLSLRTLRDHLDASFDIWAVRTGARMFTLFGGIAVLLAMIGLYGVRAYTVARRTREIGIRMALGADSRDALRMILKEGVSLTAVAVGVGLVLSLALGKILSSFLYHVSAVDPLVFAGAPILLAAAALMACYFPARRAAHVDPMVALRYE